jgi:hypothetical protein
VTSTKTAADSFVWTASDRRREERARAALEKRATNRRAELQKVADFILEGGTEGLASSTLTVEEKNFVADKRDLLIQALQNHDRVLEKMSSPSLKASLSFVLTEAIWASTGLTRFAPPVKAISRQEEYHCAAHARRARQEKPEALALFDAVFDAIGGEKVLRPTKIAVSILDQVNSRLISAGHKEVKLDVVRRVLEKVRALQERI